MSTTITQITCDLNEQVDNRYKLVLDVAEMAKRLLDETKSMGYDPFSSANATTEKVVYQALIMKASEIDTGEGLIG